MARILFYFLVCFFVISGVSLASTLSNAGISIGYLKTGTNEIGVLAWHPDFGIGSWSMGLDVNIPLGQARPEGFDSVVFRYAEFNDGKKGLRYGVIDSLTLGHGLLMKNYSTRIVGPLTLNNQQMALKGYINTDRVGIEGLSTWSHVYALRFTQRVNSYLTLGQSYVTDTDGVSAKQADGSTVTTPAMTGIAFDASVPLPLNFQGYAEAAKLWNYGSGMTVGINWGFDALAFAALFDAGYRILDNNFIPSYFNTGYENNPINIASYEANNQNKNGYVAELKLLASSFLKFDALYEFYNGSNNAGLSANASAEYDKYMASAYFKQPNFEDFRSLNAEQGAIIGYSLGYKINPNTLIVWNYKKSYDPNVGQVVENQYYEAKILF